MKKIFFILVIALFITSKNYAQLIVYDGFESGDLYTTSAAGFRWSSTSTTSVVTEDSVLFITSPVNLPAPDTSQWEAKNGNHAMMLRYNVGKSWTEQRFSWDEPHPDIWMSFWLRVPTNYSHPKKGTAGDNQKLFYLWMDGYSTKGEGSSVGMEFRGDGNGGSYFYCKISAGGYTGSGGDAGKAQFITVPRDRGKWMHLVAHIKSESALGAGDGLFRVWQKWEDETDYTKTQDLTNKNIRVASTVSGFANGYLMGWANAVYPVTTEFLIDDFTLSTTSLIDSTTTEIQKTTKAGTINVYPNPVSDHVTISSLSSKGQTTVVLSNTLGQQIGEIMNFTGKNSVQINTADLSEGIYLLTVVTNNERFTTKIIR